MKRRLLFISLIVALGLSSGCGQLVEMPELSEEETQLVTEYATGLMLKYDTKYSEKFLSEEELEKQKQKEIENLEKKRAYEEAAANYLTNVKKEEESQSSQTGSQGGDEGTQSSENVVENIAAFYGIDGAYVSYSGYTLCDSYPESGDMLLSMDATPGKQLLVLNFDVINTSGSDINFDMFYRSPVFSLSVNGEKRIHNQSTLLLDDMEAYAGTISANESVPMVLVFEVSDAINSIDSLTLKVSGNSDSGMVYLQ